MKTVLVTGASGQLGRCIQKYAEAEKDVDWLFLDSSEIDITSTFDLQQVFKSKRIDACINCAAYTNVEKAETETERAFKVNAEAVKKLAEICRQHRTVLFHFSTDYVFDGKAATPYSEEDMSNPINVYGASKLQGEENIKKTLSEFFIFRTSWLYSEFGHNFYRTILRKAGEGADLFITGAQTGAPTNANHLARLVLRLIKEENTNFGLYHFSNSGETTWYGFAREILKVSGNLSKVELQRDDSYQTLAARPAYSVLSTRKLSDNLGSSPVSWEEALEELYKTDTAAD